MSPLLRCMICGAAAVMAGAIDVRAQAPEIVWQRTFGGSRDDGLTVIIGTADGGFVLSGDTRSSNDDFEGRPPGNLTWLARLDGSGRVEWLSYPRESISESEALYQIEEDANGDLLLGGIAAYPYLETVNSQMWFMRAAPSGEVRSKLTFGGLTTEQPGRFLRTDDGVVLIGESWSNDVVITDHHGQRGGRSDILIGRFGPTSTTPLWYKSLGGTFTESFGGVVDDGSGYVMLARTESSDGDVVDNHGDADIWVIKIGYDGALLWHRLLGGEYEDSPAKMIADRNGGYVVIGGTRSIDGDLAGKRTSLNNDDCWVVRLDSAGDITWQQVYGGTGRDAGVDIVQIDGGDYIVAAHALSTDGDIGPGSAGGRDYWIARIDSTGGIVWKRNLGGSDLDALGSMRVDGNRIMLGFTTTSTDGDVQGNRGEEDIWLVALSDDGRMLWNRTFGGSGEDRLHTIIRERDGSYVIAGSTHSSDGDVQGAHGEGDIWLVRLGSSASVEAEERPDDGKTFVVGDFDGLRDLLHDRSRGTSIELYDLYGRMLVRMLVEDRNATVDLPTGVYLYRTGSGERGKVLVR